MCSNSYEIFVWMITSLFLTVHSGVDNWWGGRGLKLTVGFVEVDVYVGSHELVIEICYDLAWIPSNFYH